MKKTDYNQEHITCMQVIAPVLKAFEDFKGDLNAIYKEDGSPVTDLDIRLNDITLNTIKTNFPNDLIVSEESDYPNTIEARRIWFVDPLDGTKEILNGNSDWCLQIGLVVEGTPVYGFMLAPAKQEVYYAVARQGSYRIDLNTRESQRLASEVNDLPLQSFLVSRSRTDSSLDTIIDQNNLDKKPMGSFGIKCIGVVEDSQSAFAMLQTRCKLWDTCAPQIVAQEAGLKIAYLDDSQIEYCGVGSVDTKKPILVAAESKWQGICELLT